MIVQCCSCKRVKSGEKWEGADRQFTIEDHVSHGYCPPCKLEVLAQASRFRPASAAA